MGNRIALAAALAALILPVTPVIAAPDLGRPGDPGDGGLTTAPAPFFRPGNPFPGLPGPGGLGPDYPPAGSDGALATPAPPQRSADVAPAPPRPKPPTRGERLDKLLGRLADAKDAGEAKGIAGLVEALWMQSGSDTADLLMTRAVAAMDGTRRDVAAALLDKIIDLRPGWAEAWNKRATLRFLDDDDTGAMADISHVLVLEPRHFGALSGMGYILERHGQHAAALKALRRALSIDPQDAEIRKAVDKLAPTVDGEAL